MTVDEATVSVLMATYNGADYLTEMLSSLRQQTFQGWMLIVRDDGSCDRTLKMLNEACASDTRIKLVKDSHGNLGSMANFGLLIEHTNAPYVMFADQDDVWLPNKILDSLKALQALELEHGKHTPIIVFSDLNVTDNHLQIMHSSYVQMNGFDKAMKANRPLRGLLTQNVAPGCCMMFNQALKREASPIPAEAAMHDWWMMLVASVTGEVKFLPESTIHYRQHANNQLGAASAVDHIREVIRKGPRPYLARLHKAQLQAGALAARFAHRMNAEEFEACQVFANLGSYPPVIRQFQALNHGLVKTGWLRNLGLYLWM